MNRLLLPPALALLVLARPDAQSANQAPALLADQIDVSPDFRDFKNSYYVADALASASGREGAWHLSGKGARHLLRLWWGLALLGFSSLYREGFEVVLFLQSYRLKLGGTSVLYGVSSGFVLTLIVGVLTFVAHRRLPYRRMLVFTGVMLGLVLFVMVGEQAQEMQLARWLPRTPIPPLDGLIPGWMGLWFAVFPTVETLAAQILAAVLVVGSYLLARPQGRAQQADPA